MDDRDLLSLIRRIVYKETIWLRHYIGEVKNVTDLERLGRINVVCIDLGFNDEASGFWCYPRDKNALLTPKIGDWVEIYFMGGDQDRPVYLGKVPELDKMLPKNYDGRPTTQVPFEDPEDKIRILFDGIRNELSIGKIDFRECARKEDAVASTGAEDNPYWTFITCFTTWASAVASALNGLGVPVPFTCIVPSSLAGKITEGSSQVKVGDK